MRLLTLIILCTLSLQVGSATQRLGDERLRKTRTKEPFRATPALELDSEWEELGPSSSASDGDAWNKEAFEGVPLLLELVYREEGQEKPQMALELKLRKAVEDRGFRVLAETDLRDIADVLLRVEIDISYLQNKKENYTRAVGSSDLTLEELHGNERQHHLPGPTHEASARSPEAAQVILMKRMERDLFLLIRQKVKVRL